MIDFYTKARCAFCESDDKLTTGSVGVQVTFHFDPAWNGLYKTAVFRGSDTAVDVLITGDACTVPPEVLTKPGGDLTIGVYGTDGTGALVIPTVYADAGRIQRGAEPSGVDPEPPTPSLVDQILAAAQAAQEAAEDAAEIAQSVRDDAASGAFDGEDGAPGLNGTNGVSPTVTVTDITGGHRITITDADHPGGQSFNVMDGEDGDPGDPGTPGVGVPTGGTIGQVLKKASGTDYDTEWADESGGGGATEVFWATYGTTTTTEIKAAKAAGQIVRVAVTQDYINYVLELFEVSDDDSCEFGGITDAYVLHIEVTAPDSWGNLSLVEYAQRADIPTPQSSGTPADLGTAARGSSDDYARADHVHKKPTAADIGAYVKPSGGIPSSEMSQSVQSMLGKANTALQADDIDQGLDDQSDNPVANWVLEAAISSLRSDKLDKAQGVANAGKFLVVGSDGNITTQAMTNAETEAM